MTTPLQNMPLQDLSLSPLQASRVRPALRHATAWCWARSAAPFVALALLCASRGQAQPASELSPDKLGVSAVQATPSIGVRSLAPRSNRHALIIGISRYADPTIPLLPGTRWDRESATQIALAMQVPPGNIRYLQDDQATGDGIRGALADLSRRAEVGDRVFVHYSGHGTRFNDPNAGGCVEALMAYDGGGKGILTNREMADLLQPLVNKTDKLMVMYDACYAGGVVQAASTVRSRGFTHDDEGVLRPKFAATSEESLLLPRPNWRAKATGPAGRDNLLVLVTDGPRDLTSLGVASSATSSAEAGPFVTALNDPQGRAQ